MSDRVVVHVIQTAEEAPLMSMKGLFPAESFRLPAGKVDPGSFIPGVLLPAAQLTAGALPVGVTVTNVLAYDPIGKQLSSTVQGVEANVPVSDIVTADSVSAAYSAAAVPATAAMHVLTDAGVKVVLKKALSAFGTELDYYTIV